MHNLNNPPLIVKQLMDRIELSDPPVGARKNQQDQDDTCDRKQKQARKSDDWPDPKPLRKEIIPVIKMEPTMIPESLRPWNVDIAYRMQCPLDFVGVASICMFSLVIGAGCAIRPKQKDDWAVIPNLWGSLIGRPGDMKTPAMEAVFKLLHRLEAEAGEVFKAEMKRYEAAKAGHEAKTAAIKSKMQAAHKNGEAGEAVELEQVLAGLEAPEAPMRKRWITNDATIAKLGEPIRDNPRGIGQLFDELISFFARLDRDDHVEDRGFHLQSWNGYGTHKCDRIGRGTTESPQLCETIFGCITPSPLIAYLSRVSTEKQNDGLMQRFQLSVCPDEPDSKGDVIIVDEYPDREAATLVFEIIKKLAKQTSLSLEPR